MLGIVAVFVASCTWCYMVVLVGLGSKREGVGAEFSPIYLRHVGPTSLQHMLFFDVGKEGGQKL